MAKRLNIRRNALPVLFPHMDFTANRGFELPRLGQLFKPFRPRR